MSGVQKASLNMFWDYSPSSANPASVWLRAKSLLWMRKKGKWVTMSILHSLRGELTCLLTCGRRSLVSGTQNDTVVSSNTQWGWLKYTDLTLAYILDHAICCASVASLGLHLIKSQLRTKYSSLNCPNCLNHAQLGNALQFVELSEVCSANKRRLIKNGLNALPLARPNRLTKRDLTEKSFYPGSGFRRAFQPSLHLPPYGRRWVSQCEMWLRIFKHVFLNT